MNVMYLNVYGLYVCCIQRDKWNYLNKTEKKTLSSGIPSVRMAIVWNEKKLTTVHLLSNGMGSSRERLCSLFVAKILPGCLENVAKLRHKPELLRFLSFEILCFACGNISVMETCGRINTFPEHMVQWFCFCQCRNSCLLKATKKRSNWRSLNLARLVIHQIVGFAFNNSRYVWTVNFMEKKLLKLFK